MVGGTEGYVDCLFDGRNLSMLTGLGEGKQRLKKYLFDSLSKYLLSNNVPNTQPGGVGKMG